MRPERLSVPRITEKLSDSPTQRRRKNYCAFHNRHIHLRLFASCVGRIFCYRALEPLDGGALVVPGFGVLLWLLDARVHGAAASFNRWQLLGRHKDCCSIGFPRRCETGAVQAVAVARRRNEPDSARVLQVCELFVDNVNAALGAQWGIGHVVLPIGISFFTFTQIAYLVDVWRKGVREYKFVHYGLFVTYFPHLIAGPVLHHSQMMPQFKEGATYRFNSGNFSAGLAIFALGLFKKVVLADGVSPYADPVFAAADAGVSPSFHEAWLGAAAYTLQLYFDFSGYSDMAIGLSWMFNVRLPFNFNSPYKATNISDFWRRWHMSLSQFLRDYLYIALGGNRRGNARRYANLLTTMVLGGLWHGASWSFVIWGFLHGLYLCLNLGFRALCNRSVRTWLDGSRVYSAFAWLLTMLSVTVAWVLCRAETLPGAGRILRSMGSPQVGEPMHSLLWNSGLHVSTGALWCLVLSAIAVLGPNSNRVGDYLLVVCGQRRQVKSFVGGAAFAAVAFMLIVNTLRDSVSAFIYFNF